MEKLKFVLNVLFWSFEILARVCGYLVEIIKAVEEYRNPPEE